jgi:hypothetical protein
MIKHLKRILIFKTRNTLEVELNLGKYRAFFQEIDPTRHKYNSSRPV